MLLEMICAIPENIGWIIVGVTGSALALMAWKLGGVFVEMYKQYKEDKAEEV
jgi:hypothetical protein